MFCIYSGENQFAIIMFQTPAQDGGPHREVTFNTEQTEINMIDPGTDLIHTSI